MPDTGITDRGGMSPQHARSLEADRYSWRRIESEHTLADATETEVELIRAGRLLGHRHGGTHRRPALQFDAATGEVLPVITALLDVSRCYHVPVHDVILWLCSRTTCFAEQGKPMDRLQNLEVLLAAARDEFGAQW